jgi:hypothetical protein
MNHNMNDPRSAWTRIAAAARQVRDDRETSPPCGFATRVAALAMAQESRVVSLVERFAFRAVGVASLLALFSVVLNYEVLSGSVASSLPVAGNVESVDLIPTDDAVAIVLDLAD